MEIRSLRHFRSAAAGTAPDGPRYWAFLSYSHSDRKRADWLHSALERYRVPARLVGRPIETGTTPKRLVPIFRDFEELPASDDLREKIRDALARSRFLIVLCSPAAAASRWTNEEISTFRRLNPDRKIFAAIVAGEPGASAIPGREAEECFPPALHQRGGCASGGVGPEPVAADLRDDEHRRLGLLKLIAGMLDIGLDELVQRDSLRRQHRLAWIAGGSALGMGLAVSLAVAAVQGQHEAEERRNAAEGLVGFMLDDLRDKLEPLGRLDVLDAVGVKALDYYDEQDQKDLPDESLAQRSRALTLLGQIAQARGDLDGALARYRAAANVTAEALKRAPEDEQRIFDHAQNLFWLGSLAWQRGQNAEAERFFRGYKKLADRLVGLDPGNPDWRLERVYADTNLGALLLEHRRFGDAETVFREALSEAEALASSQPRNRAFLDLVVETLAYLADAQRYGGKLQQAMANRERQLDVLARLAAIHREDPDAKRKKMVAQMALGHLLAWRGELEAALSRFDDAAALAAELRQIEPDNARWLNLASSVEAERAALLLARGSTAQAAAAIRESCGITRNLLARDASVPEWRFTRAGQCLDVRAQLAAKRGRPAEVLALAREGVELLRSYPARHGGTGPLWSTNLLLLAGDEAAASGRRSDAVQIWQAALRSLPETRQSPLHLMQRDRTLRRMGDGAQAEAISRRLDSIGFRHPAYVRDRSG